MDESAPASRSPSAPAPATLPTVSAGSQRLADALYEIHRCTDETEDPHVALNKILAKVQDLLGASAASIAFINPDTQALETEVVHGFRDLRMAPSLALGEGVTGWVALHGRPLLVSDTREDVRYIATHPSIRSEMAVPMFDRGMVIGVVNVESTQPGAFSPPDLGVLGRLSQEAARAVTKLWLIRQLRHKAGQMTSLVNAARQLVGNRDLDRLLPQLTADALMILEARMCALFLYDERKQRLSLAALSGAGAPADYTEELNLDESTLGTVIRFRKQVEVHDLARREEHHFLPIVQRYQLVSMLATPIRGGDGEVLGVLNVYTERTHRFNNSERQILDTLAGLGGVAIQNARLYTRVFETEERLRQNERLTTLGLLAAEIAHEIRNPLTVIKLLFGSLDLAYDKDDPRHRDVEVIGEKLDQLESIVSRVLSFGKSREGLHSRWSANKLVDDTLHLVRLKLARSNITLETAFDDDDPVTVEGSRGQLQQALLNLIMNAVAAMPEGGTLRVSTRATEDGDRPPGVEILIGDTGSGIPAAIEDKVFESFLSGRSDGTGLGLSIVKRIAAAHRGAATIHTTSDEGTTMALWLPRAEEA